jgi:peptidoglycan hydrolase CwlO-like protein
MKQVVIYGIIAVFVVIMIFLVARNYKNEEFTLSSNDSNDSNDKDTQIIENYPTPPQNVITSDANGNLSVSNDLGLQHLTVAGNAQVGNLSVKNRNIIDVLDSLKTQIDATNTKVDSTNAASTAASAAIAVVASKIAQKGFF